ncbi:hypothetical protein C8R44DRAFT_769764 [Mycena epipterygia]|nr:hypothetical protein C8R44DRAFT_769764 [Mycena epipterygia]
MTTCYIKPPRHSRTGSSSNMPTAAPMPLPTPASDVPNGNVVNVPKMKPGKEDEAPPVVNLKVPAERFPTRATVNEVCHNFVRNQCFWGPRCHRIHIRPLVQGQPTHSKNPLDSRSRTDAVFATNPYIVKLPKQGFREGNNQTSSDRFNSQSSCIIDLTTRDSSTPVVRLRRLCCYPPENPSQNNIPNMYRYDELSWDEQTSSWGWKADDTAWGNSSLSSDDSFTESSSSAMSTAGTVSSRSSDPNQPQTRIKYPPPRFKEVCWNWLRDRCQYGHRCRFIHEDLDYDYPETRRDPPPPAPESQLSITVHDHTKVKIGAGFEIHDVTTSVETPWINLSNIPVRTKSNAISQLLAPFGSVLDLKLPATPPKDFMTVRARFSCHAEALQASTALDGSMAFKSRISARIPVNSRNGMVSIQDSTVRIQWEAPQKIAYGGYPSLTRAQEAIAAAKALCDDYCVSASIYVGLPSIGNVTVKFLHLPPSADETYMERFAHPEDIMWERPNYLALSPAVDGIRRLLHSLGNMLELDVLPPPYSQGVVRAWATFSSSSAARSAAGGLHGRKPVCTGKTRIFARHVQTLAYNVALDSYAKDAPLVDALREAAFRDGSGMTVAVRRLPACMLIRLSAEGTQALGWLKTEFEKISRGEILRCDGVVVWDGFFGRPGGRSYLQGLAVNEPDVRVEIDAVRRVLKLFGTPPKRAIVRTMLLQKMADLKAQRVRVIRVPGRVVSAFISTQLTQLCNKFGAENISVDIWERTVTLRGDDDLFEAGVEAVHRVQQSPLAHLKYRRNVVECPVCFNEVVSPINLPCGHIWCRACLSQYLLAALENRRFPLKCLGDEAKCIERIPLTVARNILQSTEFNSVVEASLSSYVHAHAKEFHYCPSPDCLQIYRTGPKGTVVQCPACLLRICPHCHAEAHDGFTCAEQDGGDRLFKEWAASHDVKNCPGCAIPIERDEGCHHVTCIQCQTHICWVCLKTFPKGEGIYGHMRAEHGGIGLGQD